MTVHCATIFPPTFCKWDCCSAYLQPNLLLVLYANLSERRKWLCKYFPRLFQWKMGGWGRNKHLYWFSHAPFLTLWRNAGFSALILMMVGLLSAGSLHCWPRRQEWSQLKVDHLESQGQDLDHGGWRRSLCGVQVPWEWSDWWYECDPMQQEEKEPCC